MSRTRKVATALALAGGVYLATGTAQASNMGFKLERSFDLIRNASGGAQQNIYWLSQPLFNGLADNGVGGTSPCCVGMTGCAATGDGAITALDAICEYWTARNNAGQEGAFQFTFLDRTNCIPTSLTGAKAGTRFIFTGTNFPLQPDIGYQINIGSSGPTVTPQNRAVVVGSHDPSFAGRMIGPGAACGASAPQRDLLNLPYHTMYQSSDEILCGLEGVAFPAGEDPPSVCFDTANNLATGLFDGTHAFQVEWFENTPTSSLPHGRTVTKVGTRLIFTGSRFPLVPGESYRVTMTSAQVPTRWLSPHF